MSTSRCGNICIMKPKCLRKERRRGFSYRSSVDAAMSGDIYETNLRPEIVHTVVSTQNLEFINLDISGDYDQISRQVWLEFLS